MRLLVVTQMVDRDDPILGFFHRWLEECAAVFDGVEAIGQRVGSHALPVAVHVHSLGKERDAGKILQVVRFWRLQWLLHRQYDVVLVHMTPIWVVLGAPLWWLLQKKIYLWYEARGARWPLRLALLCVTKVFSASSHGMPVATPKSVITGHGIDTDLFVPGSGARAADLLLTVGRITKAKKLAVLIHCMRDLPSSLQLTIIGKAITAQDEVLRASLCELIGTLGLKGRVLMEERTHRDIVSLLQHASIFLHASDTGLDKAVLEAMACGVLVLSSSGPARAVLPPACHTTDAGMAEAVLRLRALPASEQDLLRKELRERVTKEHGLKQLVQRLKKEME